MLKPEGAKSILNHQGVQKKLFAGSHACGETNCALDRAADMIVFRSFRRETCCTARPPGSLSRRRIRGNLHYQEERTAQHNENHRGTSPEAEAPPIPIPPCRHMRQQILPGGMDACTRAGGATYN